jgi:hypothetical protein
MLLTSDGEKQMAKNVEIGKCYTNGRQIIKVVYKNAGMAGYDCYLWVKTKSSKQERD